MGRNTLERGNIYDYISSSKSWWKLLIGMFFHNVKKMVHSDISPVGKMALNKKQILCFRSSQIINNLFSNSHVCHEDILDEIM